MDALLPSEVARLVLGYLQEQKCDEAAKLFMETSPLLQECRLVSQKGGRYSTKVGGSSLTDILDKYCAANAMVQDKLNKVSDSEQLKQCNDILEQLGYLLEGSRKRFVVNINYSSQSSPAGHFGAQNASGSSSKKRRSDNENRSKRVARSLNALIDKSPHSQVNQDCDMVEATYLDSLVSQQKSSAGQVNIDNEGFSSDLPLNATSVNNVKESRVSTSLNVNSDVNIEVTSSNNVNTNCKDQATETSQVNETTKNINQCTAGTSTKELMNYCNTEVQTCFDLFDTESELRTEPIQNISILTQELINRKELQQRIAENINNAILPIESSFHEDDPNTSITDLNKSKLSDLDSVIKTAVKATESDLEGILHEIFDINENNAQPEVNTNFKYNSMPEAMEIDHGSDFYQDTQESPEPLESDQKHSGTSEIPIKQRLRSSSKCFNIDEEVRDSNALIEDQNAEAIMNIINCNVSKRNSLTDSEPISEINAEINNIEAVKENITSNENVPTETETIKCIDKKSKSKKINAKKSNARKPKQPQRRYLKRQKKAIVMEEESVPTIVICSEVLSSKSCYVPIIPKEGEPLTSSDLKEPPTLSYRVVNVPRHLVKPEQIEISKISETIVQKTLQEYQAICPTSSNDTTIMPIIVQSSNESVAPVSELITLYGTQENDNEEVATVPSISDMPIISLDSSLIGTGLSPFFKGNTVSSEPEVVDIVVLPNAEDVECPTEKQIEAVKEIPEVTEEHFDSSKPVTVTSDPEPTDQLNASNKLKSDEIIAKRTPNTLLRSRSKNNRLSLSTPRRRNSHIRALDFGTPVKPIDITKKGTQSCIKPSVCRSSLFKSPSYKGTNESSIVQTMMITTKKVRTLPPMKSSTQVALMNVPIATRSPAPKLRGNWNKVAGIGMILNESSTGESSPEKSQSEYPTSQLQASPSFTPPKPMEEMVDSVLQKSWDSDLRKIVGNSADEEEEEKIKLKRQRKSERKSSATKVKTINKVEEKTDAVAEKDSKINNNIKKDDLTEEVKKSGNKVSSLKEDTRQNDDMKKEQKEIENDTKDDNNKQEKIAKQNKTGLTDLKAEASSTITLRVSSQQNIKITPPSDRKSKPKPIHDDSSLNKNQFSQSPLDLETPRKTEMMMCIPQTPQVFATPAPSLRKIATTKADVPIKDIVETPEYPITPCIVVTPRIVEEDPEKRPSPYYEPSEEIMKEVNDKIRVQETTTAIIKKSVELQDHKTIEITQLGVVEKKEQLEEQSIKEKQSTEDNIKDNSKDSLNNNSKDTSKGSVDEEDADSSGNSSSDSDEESSNDSSSSSSSSSSSNTSSSSSSPESSPDKPIPDTRDVIKKYSNDDVNIPMDSPASLMQSFAEISQEEISNHEAKVKNNSSPEKVFSITKKLSEENPKETPAKDENAEAVISETPSVSESGRTRDSLTNGIPRLSAALATSSQSVSTSSSRDVSVENPQESLTKDENAKAITSNAQSVSEAECLPRSDSTLNVISRPSASSTTSSRSVSTTSSRDVSSEISTTEQSTTNNNFNAKPKIIKIENCIFQVSKMLQSETARVPISTIQTNSHADAKLGQALEEKRLRVMAKFKGRVDAKPVVRSRKSIDDKQKKVTVTDETAKVEKVSLKTDNIRSQSKSSEQSQVVVEEKVTSNNEEKATTKQEEKGVSREEKSMITRSSRALQKADEEDLKENKTSKNRSSPRKKTEMSNKKTESNNVEFNDQKKDKEMRTIKGTTTATTTVMPTENSKGISKAKVDLVKRDLFSDDENNEQRTTRSQSTRRTTTLLESQKSSEKNASNDNSKLLECLQLIPANKSDIENHDVNEINEEDVLNTSGRNHLDMTVKYNESVPIKKRRRNYSNCELQNEYVLQMDAEDDIVLKVTPYEEMFQMNPITKSKKKILSPKKTPIKICKKKKKKNKNGDEPLASSSPLVKSTSNKDEEEKRKKSCKRKATSPNEDKKMDNKSNPWSLLKKLKIEELLKSVNEKGK